MFARPKMFHILSGKKAQALEEIELCHLIYISLLSASFISCDSAYRFIVCNTSKQEKKVQVILPTNFYVVPWN